jgi:acyl-CoA synthetase (NDP forming)
LKRYEIPLPRYAFLRTRKDLEKLALAYPLVLKACVPNVLHKSDIGAVALNIGNEKELHETYEEFQRRFPGAELLAETMEERGVELLVGLAQDRAFGLVLTCGVGGIFTELYKDVAVRVLPLTRKDAREMLTELRARALLEGYRSQRVAKEKIVDLLCKVNRLGMDFRDSIYSLDLNPVFAREKDVVVVDAVLIGADFSRSPARFAAR